MGGPAVALFFIFIRQLSSHPMKKAPWSMIGRPVKMNYSFDRFDPANVVAKVAGTSEVEVFLSKPAESVSGTETAKRVRAKCTSPFAQVQRFLKPLVNFDYPNVQIPGSNMVHAVGRRCWRGSRHVRSFAYSRFENRCPVVDAFADNVFDGFPLLDTNAAGTWPSFGP
jgi:hypothetical protein